MSECVSVRIDFLRALRSNEATPDNENGLKRCAFVQSCALRADFSQKGVSGHKTSRNAISITRREISYTKQKLPSLQKATEVTTP